jgi:hypothetical protein
MSFGGSTAILYKIRCQQKENCGLLNNQEKQDSRLRPAFLAKRVQLFFKNPPKKLKRKASALKKPKQTTYIKYPRHTNYQDTTNYQDH